MKIEKTEFPGLLIIEPDTFTDSRGYFFESYNSRRFHEAGFDYSPVQDNESSSSKGVIRGLHYQTEPYAQAKLIRVIKGEIFDVALDLRQGSPTFGKWYGIRIDSALKKQFFIPRGFAHGFSVLSENAIILYKCDNFYSARHEEGISALDPDLGINWGLHPGNEILSQKDINLPRFKDISPNFIFKG